MNKEQFTHLVEIQSLNTKIIEFDRSTSSQRERISLLNRQINEAKQNQLTLESEKENTSKLVQHLEKENAELTQLIERTTKNLEDAKTEKQAALGEKELKNLCPRLTKNEEDILETWEKIESLDSKLSDKKQFQEGADKTLLEIQSEVDSISKKNKKEIQHLNERKGELIEMLPNEEKTVYLNLESKYPLPITYLENKQCGRCKGAIDHSLLTQINSLNSICLCPFCERIIISPEVQY